MRALLKKRSTQLLLLVLCALFVVFCVQAFVAAKQETHTKTIARDFGAALHQLQESPPGTQRVETFVARLKGIDTGSAPVEVRQALQEYILVVGQSLDAAKEGRDVKPYDHAIAQAEQRLAETVRESE